MENKKKEQGDNIQNTKEKIEKISRHMELLKTFNHSSEGSSPWQEDSRYKKK